VNTESSKDMSIVNPQDPQPMIEQGPVLPCKLETDQRILLHVEGLNKSFGGQIVLDGISLELCRGEVVLLRGDNGSGKTTLLNILTGNLEPDAGIIRLYTNGVEENFHFPRLWWENINPFDHFTPERVSNEGVGRTWQEVRLFSTHSLRDNVALATPGQVGENPAWVMLRPFTVRNQEQQILNTTKAMLAGLGLKGRETSSADKVSLGQSKRVAIARAIQAGARIIFLDEPLSGLDAPGVSEVMELLKELADEHKVTLVIVEHIFNIPRVLNLATTVWTLKDGKVSVESPNKVKAEIEHFGVNGFRDWLKDLSGPEGKIVDQKLPDGAVLSTVIPAGANLDSTNDVLLEIQDLVVYRGNRLVIGKQMEDGHIQGLSFSLPKNKITVLQAPNGWGKTTLMEAILGLIPITQGLIQLNGQPIQNLPTWERAKLGISFVQARNHTFPRLTVKEVLQLAKLSEIPESLKPLIEKRMSDLSGGEKQRVALACVNGKVPLLLMDEPFSALDSVGLNGILEIFRKTVRETILVAVPGALII